MNNKNSLTPICDFVRDYAASGISRFHMPGHKGIEVLPGNPERLDLTEINGADALYDANGIIAESEHNASALFGTGATFYSTEGSSHCIRAMLMLAAQFFKFCRADSSVSKARPVILAARNVHRAFLTACASLDLDVEWVFSEAESYSLCACPVTPEQIHRKINSMSRKPAAVYLTSPDYLGNLQDIESIASVSHEYGIPLLVDNAHGAYLHFLKSTLHPMDLGADLCCDSAHKTLPALTGCAYLHVAAPHAETTNNEDVTVSFPQNAETDVFRRYCIANAKKSLVMFGSTSPSYLLLQSLDQINVRSFSGWQEQFLSCIEAVQECKDTLEKAGWQFVGSEPMKLTVDAAAAGYSGQELTDLLRTYKIECEYADPDYVVLMPSPFNRKEDFQRLMNAFSSIQVKESENTPLPGQPPFPERACSIREAMFAPSELVLAEQSVGRICADAAIACPPAIPLLVCGEVISKEFLPLFHHYQIDKIPVLSEKGMEL